MSDTKQPDQPHRFQRGGRIYDQVCGLCNAVADAPIHQMGDIERATAQSPQPDLVQEVEELLAKATPQWEQSQLAPAYVISLAEGHEVICSFGEYEKDGTLETEFKNAVNNMALTIRAPDLLRRLVEEVKRERKALKMVVQLWDDNNPDDPCGCVGASDDCRYPPTCELCVARMLMEGRDPNA